MIFPSVGECFLDRISVHRERRRAREVAGVPSDSPEIYPSRPPTPGLDVIGGRGRPPQRLPALAGRCPA
jgi:hypothetical protein